MNPANFKTICICLFINTCLVYSNVKDKLNDSSHLTVEECNQKIDKVCSIKAKSKDAKKFEKQIYKNSKESIKIKDNEQIKGHKVEKTPPKALKKVEKQNPKTEKQAKETVLVKEDNQFDKYIKKKSQEEIKNEKEMQWDLNDKHLKLIGNGGCRGLNWSSGKWPKYSGRTNLVECANKCVHDQDGCTAFHAAKPQDNGESYECLLFGHSDIINVMQLGGRCYQLISPISNYISISSDEEELDERNFEEIYPTLLGYGMCRGPEWSTKIWPRSMGYKSLNQCANDCLRKKCTAFDLSEEHDGKSKCTLYGHHDIIAAKGVSGQCYTVSTTKTKEEQNNKLHSNIQEIENIADDSEQQGVCHHKKLGNGMCRGEHWQRNQEWPKEMGHKSSSVEHCCKYCFKAKGCTAFDISPQGCTLYGHKKPQAASGVPGVCYINTLSETKQPQYEETDDIPQLKDKNVIKNHNENIPYIHNIGKGMCRGSNWQNENWPKIIGIVKSLKKCATSCKIKQGCTSFDFSPQNGNGQFHCVIYGHAFPVAASGLPGTCYGINRPMDKNKIELKEVVHTKIYDKMDQKYLGKVNEFEHLGKGLCRGENWQNKIWPKSRIVTKIEECAIWCAHDKSCTAYDVTKTAETEKFNCNIFAHNKIQPASALKGDCYKRTMSLSSKEELEKMKDEDNKIDLKGFNNDISVNLKHIGKGSCRGPMWQQKDWPKTRKRMKINDCSIECSKTHGCTSFATSDGDQNEIFDCLLFGHKNVIPATGVPGNCYTFINTPKQDDNTLKVEKSSKKKYKIPEFKNPITKEDDYNNDASNDDIEWLFEPPPSEIRSRKHIEEILHSNESENILKHEKTIIETTLKELRKIYETTIKPLETIYSYKDLSNRHFGDPEIFNKPLIVLMGPWSGGKSTMINYLLGTEFTQNAFRTAAEPSPGFNFNIAMYGNHETDMDGAEIVTEWTFSSLQKYGQQFLKRLQGKRISNALLEKVTFAEIPGVLETGTIRKLEDRDYPFNDACQWFIDHADLILLVYDYTKLDVGTETEALLDQLKGRESQVRIILNKADEITADELLKIQSNLIWNISPLMASKEPPLMYVGSFWSHTYHEAAPKKLMRAQEEALLKDIKNAIVKRVENRIATARRFAVRIRNHAKMVDCYLNTYNNHKGMFGNKEVIVQEIIENPTKFHIYESLSLITNISRYDLPDPKMYNEFFNTHWLPDFPSLQSTCTFFKGCPINRLDISIAYDLPELLTTHKKRMKNV